MNVRYRAVIIRDSLSLGKRAASGSYMFCTLDVCFCEPVCIAGDMCPKYGDKAVSFHLRLHEPEVMDVAGVPQGLADRLDSPERAAWKQGLWRQL
jgi:hypothetical protein